VFESGAEIVVGGITPKKFTKGREILEEMQLSMSDFIRIYGFIQGFLRNKTSPSSPGCEKHQGRPHTYDDTLTLAKN